MKPHILTLFVGPDGTWSSKRTLGWAAFLFSCLLALRAAWHGDGETILYLVGMYLGAALTALGISTLDANNYLRAGREPKQSWTPAVGPDPTVAGPVPDPRQP